MQPSFVCRRLFSVAIRSTRATRKVMTVASSSSRMPNPPAPLLSVAPMMDWTDVHYRQLARLLSRNAWLYTEMVVDNTIIHNQDHDRFLWFPQEQHPIVCQLGGSNPELLAQAATVVARYGYDEINLNCGCPSDRVAGSGCFGASMMLQPDNVAACCAAMAAVSEGIPITVKCRIGVDDIDSYDSFHKFIKAVSSNSPVTHFQIHARKCLLNGLSPQQNRTIPPLRYQWVWALKRDFPHLTFSLNGGILTLEEAAAALRMPSETAPGAIGGVMVGRAAYSDPWRVLGNADVALWGTETNPAQSRREVLRAYAEYADGMIGRWHISEDGHRRPNVRCLTKPLLGMFHGEPRGKKWRAAVDTALKTAGSVTEVLDATLSVLLPETLDAPPKEIKAVEATVEACKALLSHYIEDEIPPMPEPESEADKAAREEVAELAGAAAS